MTHLSFGRLAITWEWESATASRKLMTVSNPKESPKMWLTSGGGTTGRDYFKH